ncbi:MAG: anaerobic ribonucleoside-triphosphate reductase activating protein [Bacilli bacterium]
MKIRLAQSLESDSIVDGQGVRTVIWTQGCRHNCKGCHNPLTHSFTSGFLIDIEEIKKEIANLKIQDGITFSGGDPMCQPLPCLEIAKYCKQLGLNIWCYTGYTFEQLLEMDTAKEFLKYIDVLVDSKFILEQRSLDLKFKGSRNQRIIDVKKSLENKQVILITKYDKEVIKEVKKEIYI